VRGLYGWINEDDFSFAVTILSRHRFSDYRQGKAQITVRNRTISRLPRMKLAGGSAW